MAIRSLLPYSILFVVMAVGSFFVLYEFGLDGSEYVPVSIQQITTYDMNSYISKPIQPSIFTHRALVFCFLPCDDLLARVKANKNKYINESNIYKFNVVNNMGTCNFGNLVGPPCYGSSSAPECQPRYNYIDPNGNYFYNSNEQVVYLNVSSRVDMYLKCDVNFTYRYKDVVYTSITYTSLECSEDEIINKTVNMYYVPSCEHPFYKSPVYRTKQDPETIVVFVFASVATALVLTNILGIVINRIKIKNNCFNFSKLQRFRSIKKNNFAELDEIK